MTRFHISQDGVPRHCKAKSQETCTAVGPDGSASPHGEFENMAQVMRFAESVNSEAAGKNSLGSISKTSSNQASQMSSRRAGNILRTSYGSERHAEVSNVLAVLEREGEIEGLTIKKSSYPTDGRKTLDSARVGMPLRRRGELELEIDSKRDVVWVRPTLSYSEEEFTRWGNEEGYNMDSQRGRQELIGDMEIKEKDGRYFIALPEQRHQVSTGRSLKNTIVSVYHGLREEELNYYAEYDG